ncbi:MAG: glycoside hydrolase family 32, partial [Butyrivibrio sp.]|nr:glycoside hydrolase family 32 [Butyrivibrio sp.]
MNECLFPRTEDSYVGDVMALSTEKGVYLNYLYETDNNGVGYHPIHQFYTGNFVSFEDRGQVLAYSEEMEAPDLAVGTGSFIIDDAGTYHCFYTGHNGYYEEYGLDKECLMHATSKDNKTYDKDSDNIIHAPEGYSTEDFRDPQ